MGEAGDHSLGSGMVRVSLAAGPVVRAISLPASDAITVASVAAVVVSSNVTLPLMAGVIFAAVRWVAGTCSNHTVCQMPVTGVYQIPPGLPTCLPWS